MNLYKCSINLYIFNTFVLDKYIAIFIIMYIASQIEVPQKSMRQFQIMSLVPHPQIGTFYEELWPGGWQMQNRYLNIYNASY